MPKLTIRWRRQEAATGLARVTQGFRQWYYGDGDRNTYMTIYQGSEEGTFIYYYRVRVYLVIGNRTLNEKFKDVEVAKKTAKEWFVKNRAHFREG